MNTTSCERTANTARNAAASDASTSTARNTAANIVSNATADAANNTGPTTATDEAAVLFLSQLLDIAEQGIKLANVNVLQAAQQLPTHGNDKFLLLLSVEK